MDASDSSGPSPDLRRRVMSVSVRWWYQCDYELHEFLRRHDDVGGAVTIGAFELQHDLALAIAA
jgi:hypothetical protein